MEEQTAYLDNAATTRPCAQAIEAASRMMRECYGNPSSLHALGASAARALAQAREQVAELLGCEAESICFTSGGSEANNLALFGAAQAKARRGRRVVTTAGEHSSVAGALRRLAETGWEVVYIPPGSDGRIDPEAVLQAVDGQTSLVSVMHVNNETGAIFPVEMCAKRLRTAFPELLIHSDGVQALGKLPLRLQRSQIDLYSVSAHKIGAPKGAGALYLRRGVRIPPLICGGGQERGLRAGTEGLPMIAAFGAACERLRGSERTNLARAQALWNFLRTELAQYEGLCIHSPADGSPYIMNFSIPGYRSETMLHFLESRSVYVSSGSACSKGAASPVLQAMGLSPRQIDSALRVSLIYDTTQAQIQQLLDALSAGITAVAHE